MAYVLSDHKDTAFVELKALLEPLASLSSTRMIGERINGSLNLRSIPLAKSILKPLSESISSCAPGLSDWLVKQFSFPSPSGYMMQSSDCSSTVISLDYPFSYQSTCLEHYRFIAPTSTNIDKAVAAVLPEVQRIRSHCDRSQN